MNEAPKYKVTFTIQNKITKKEFVETMEGQYPDSLKTDMYKKYDRSRFKISFTLDRIDL